MLLSHFYLISGGIFPKYQVAMNSNIRFPQHILTEYGTLKHLSCNLLQICGIIENAILHRAFILVAEWELESLVFTLH